MRFCIALIVLLTTEFVADITSYMVVCMHDVSVAYDLQGTSKNYYLQPLAVNNSYTA